MSGILFIIYCCSLLIVLSNMPAYAFVDDPPPMPYAEEAAAKKQAEEKEKQAKEDWRRKREQEQQEKQDIKMERLERIYGHYEYVSGQKKLGEMDILNNTPDSIRFSLANWAIQGRLCRVTDKIAHLTYDDYSGLIATVHEDKCRIIIRFSRDTENVRIETHDGNCPSYCEGGGLMIGPYNKASKNSGNLSEAESVNIPHSASSNTQGAANSPSPASTKPMNIPNILRGLFGK